MDKGNLAIDPRGLIFESYRMEGIRIEECRSIFLDWALGVASDTDMRAALFALRDEYALNHPDHPMSAIINEGLTRSEAKKGRRRGRASRD